MLKLFVTPANEDDRLVSNDAHGKKLAYAYEATPVLSNKYDCSEFRGAFFPVNHMG